MSAPRILLDRLRALARQERGLRLGWGLSRWLGLVVVMLILSCAFDWLIDLWDDTPVAARLFLAALQAGLAGFGLYAWVLKPIRTGLGLEAMALWVEGREAKHGHRLISAVQLNQPDAGRFGMSAFLIDAMTEQAETEATDRDFTTLLDRQRVRWSFLLLVPALALPLIFWLIAPDTVAALLQRQYGSEVRIPRGIAMTPQTAELWPSGEPGDAALSRGGQLEGATDWTRRGRAGRPGEGDVRAQVPGAGADGRAGVFHGDSAGVVDAVRVPSVAVRWADVRSGAGSVRAAAGAGVMGGLAAAAQLRRSAPGRPGLRAGADQG